MTKPSIRATVYALTDRGRTREHNEDTFLVADLANGSAQRDSEATDHSVGLHGTLYLVADGMGGAAAGELASEMAAVEIHRQMVDRWSGDPGGSEETFARHIRDAVEQANTVLHSYAIEHPDVRGMGTTATVVGVLNDHIYLAQIGDSRGYLVRDGEARQLTRDQSLTQRLVEVGEMTEEEAESSDRRNIILQALGPDEAVKVDMSRQALQRGDLLILCSDGLSSVVRKSDIAEIAREGSVATICRRLVDLANERGGPDNITVVAVRFDGESLPEQAHGEAGYQPYLTEVDRPSLQPTAAFPATSRPPVSEEEPIAVVRRGAPPGMIVAAVVVAIGMIALAVWFSLR